jgi:hypothetical protein
VSALDDFLWEHRTGDLPITDGLLDYDGAPSTALYAAYQAYCLTADRTVMKVPEWRKAMVAAGREPMKVESGMVYADLTVASRHERAQARVIHDLRNMAAALERSAAIGAHRLRRHPDGDTCEHIPPPAETQAIADRVAAAVEAYQAEGMVDSEVAIRFGWYLRRQPGEPPVTRSVQLAAALAHRAALQAEEAALSTRIAEGPGPEPKRYDTPSGEPPPAMSSLLDRLVAGVAAGMPRPEWNAWWERRGEIAMAERRLAECRRERTALEVSMMPKNAAAVADVPDQETGPDQDGEW